MSFSFAPYKRKLKQPFVYGERSITEREGFCLRIELAEGVFYSEASPLPGHSRDDFAQVEGVLQVVPGFSLFEAVIDNSPAAEALHPSLRFALEGLEAQRRASHKQGATVNSNALVPWQGLEATLAAVLEKKKAGYQTVKLKIFSDSIGELLELISSLPKDAPKLRLDANRALSETALKELFAGLEKNGAEKIEYLEEPLGHWRHPILAEAPIALAADECAADPRFWRALLQSPAGGPSVYVLKPTVAGGLSSLAEKAKILEGAGKKVVYTSSFEAEPGRRAIICFLSQNGRKITAGVSTGSLFQESYLPDAPINSAAPFPSPEELTWLETLAWRESHS